jgi:peptidoglycan/LPS O-acetylase OafA/YrhL
MLHHFALQTSYSGFMERVFSHIASLGFIGVDLFFVLSGFLITGILYDAKGAGGFFQSFYMRRVLRIFPLYYAVLVGALVLLPLLKPFSEEMTVITENQGWLWLFSANIITGLHDKWIFNSGLLSLSHFWTLAVEEHFYLVWPALVFLFGRRQLMMICFGAIGTAFLSRAWLLSVTDADLPVALYTWCRMDSLAIGALLALAVRGQEGPAALKKVVWVAGVVGALGMALIAGGKMNHWTYCTFGMSAQAVFFGAVLFTAVIAPDSSVWSRFWSSKALRMVGKYSYGLYVLHAALIPLFNRAFPVPKLESVFHLHSLAIAVYILLCSGVSLGAAWLSWHCYEKHFLKFKGFFEYRRKDESIVVGAATFNA